MKAVILEIKGENAAALSDDGCILKVKNKKYAIGQVIELRKSNRASTRFVVWAASAAAAVIVLGTGAWAYFTPYTYVSLDVNPSIEYTVNRFDRVLSATAVNNDGQEILQNLDLKNQTIDSAVKETVDEISKKGYFEGTDPGAIMISTSSDNTQESQQMADELKTAAQVETQNTAAPVEVEAVSVGLARVQQARTLGTTPGKLNLVEKLQAGSEVPDSIHVEDWLKKPVKEIMKAIKQNRKDTNAASSKPSSSSSEVSSQDSTTSSSSSEVSSKNSSESVSQTSKAQTKENVKNNRKSKSSETSSVTSGSTSQAAAERYSGTSSDETSSSKTNKKYLKNPNYYSGT